MKKRCFLIAIVVFFSFNYSSAQSNRECIQIPELDAQIDSGMILLIGEIHGTKEAPELIQQIACHSLKRGIEVSIFLELPQTDQALLDEYINSEGIEGNRNKLLSSSFWSRSYQDGRSSTAMFRLIEEIRKLKMEGDSLHLILIDNPGATNRDQIMADKITEVISQRPANFFLSLTGNYHNMIFDGANQMGEYVVKKIGREKVISLNLSYTGGTAWVCMSNGCGPAKMGTSGNKAIGVYLNDYEGGDYDGILQIDSIHASPPAKELLKL